MAKTIIKCSSCSQDTRINNKKASLNLAKVKCGHCKKPLFIPKYTNIPNLQSSDYQHPMDLKAKSALDKIPGINSVLKILLKEGLVKYQHLFIRQNCIQVRGNHLKKYYKMVKRSANVLGIEKLPELYIQQNPSPNAFTFGAEDHVIVITTALIDLLEDEEIETVIAHELGHIQCDHVLYKTTARLLSSLAMEVSGRIFGIASSMIYPIIYGLLYWDRISELSADRAEILVNQNYRISVKVLLKIAGGSRVLNKHLDIDEFLIQAEETEELTENSLIEKIYHIIQQSASTHHFPTWRAKLILDWSRQSQVFQIIAGQQVKPNFKQDNKQAANNKAETEPKKDNNSSDEPIGVADIIRQFKNILGKE